ncbi:MAG: hypothetical protein ACW964_16695 [Candidatus Hodarchaeales archaeon]|jgi:hypothetical protein
MLSSEIDPLVEDLAWEVMIVSVFRQTERQTLNLISSLVGVTDPRETSTLVKHIFRLVRKGIIYIPEARLQIFHETPELVDVYFIHPDFDTCMKGLVQELNNLKAEMKRLAERKKIPEKIFIDLKNWSQGKYI